MVLPSLAAPDHLGAIGVTALLCVGLCTAFRRWPGPWTVAVRRVLAVVLVANLAVWQIVTVATHSWLASNALMLDLCPVTAVIAAVALWRPRPLLVELAYFWGLAGTVQGVITPDRRYHFPEYFWFQFYITHSGVVLAALLLVVGMGISPRPRAVPRMFVLTAGFAAVAAVADVLSGGNYMYLRNPGPRGTLLDFMGPWPWYIATGAGLALAFLTILDAPFALRRRAIAAAPTSARTPG